MSRHAVIEILISRNERAVVYLNRLNANGRAITDLGEFCRKDASCNRLCFKWRFKYKQRFQY